MQTFVLPKSLLINRRHLSLSTSEAAGSLTGRMAAITVLGNTVVNNYIDDSGGVSIGVDFDDDGCGYRGGDGSGGSGGNYTQLNTC